MNEWRDEWENVKLWWADIDEGRLKHLQKYKFQFQVIHKKNPTLTGVGLNEALAVWAM